MMPTRNCTCTPTCSTIYAHAFKLGKALRKEMAARAPLPPPRLYFSDDQHLFGPADPDLDQVQVLTKVDTNLITKIVRG